MAEGDKRRRDVRIDQIGFAGELQKHFVEPLREAVKAAHGAGALLEGVFFEARIDAAETTTVDPERWLKLFNDGEISRKQYLEGLRVSTTDARRILDEKTFERISTTTPAADRLTVTRKKGVETGLVHAVNSLSATINAEKRSAA